MSYHRESTTGCLQTMTSYRSQLGDGDDLSHLHIATSASGCPGGTLFNMYFEREGTVQPVALNPAPVPITNLILPNLPAGASHGRYWVAAVDPQSGAEFRSSPAVNDGLHSTGADTGSEPGEASRNLRFAHLDHLGSTRMITDEAGEVVARLKFYPFGMEAETSGGDATRMKFTGHERDGDVHVDYMLARYYAAGLGRFLSVDPVIGKAGDPGSWNRLGYSLNRPVILVDPDGRAAVLADAVGQTFSAVADGVRPWESQYVEIRMDGQGDDITVSIDPGAINEALDSGQLPDPSSNFQILAEVVNSDQVVELHTATDTFTRSGYTKTLGDAGSAGVENARGHTVTPDASASGNTQVYVRSDQQGIDRTGTMWHELGGHAAPAMRGEPSGHRQGTVDEDARKAQAEAMVNYSHKDD